MSRRNRQYNPKTTSTSPAPGVTDSARTWLDRPAVILGLCLATLLLSLPLFAPLSWWPFGYVVLVPWLLVIVGSSRSRFVYLISFAVAYAYMLIHLRWLSFTTIPGYFAGALSQTFALWLAAWPIRHLCRRRGLPATLVVPVVWIACELMRSRGPLAFPWFLLGHSQIRLTTMIQCCDLAGVETLSFVLAAVNGLCVDYLLRRFGAGPSAPAAWRSRRRLAVSGVCVGAILAAVIGYGQYRLRSWEVLEGPRIAVVQGDFLLAAVRGVDAVDNSTKFTTYMRMADAAAQLSPDMIVLPETPWSSVLNPEILAVEPLWKPVQDLVQSRIQGYGCYFVTGGSAEMPQPEGSYPERHVYNSAFVYTPGNPTPERYDKIHLVPFGEFVPFRYSKHFFWLYRFLNDSWFNPWGSGGHEYSVTPGDTFRTFSMHRRADTQNTHDFAVTICYEDVIPQIFRRFVTDPDGRKRVDFMLNISNDGWFSHSAQQPQHLVNCAFRAVENRVAVARAVNTGVSGFLSPDGTWHNLISHTGGPTAGGSGQRSATLLLDERRSIYSVYGDWLAYLCLAVTLLAIADAVVALWRKPPEPASR